MEFYEAARPPAIRLIKIDAQSVASIIGHIEDMGNARRILLHAFSLECGSEWRWRLNIDGP